MFILRSMHFSKSIFFGEFKYYVLNTHIYICMYEQRVYLSLKGYKQEHNTRKHFMRAFWNAKEFNLDRRREARKTSRCDWRLRARCSESWLAWRKQAGFHIEPPYYSSQKKFSIEEQIYKDNIIYRPKIKKIEQ